MSSAKVMGGHLVRDARDFEASVQMSPHIHAFVQYAQHGDHAVLVLEGEEMSGTAHGCDRHLNTPEGVQKHDLFAGVDQTNATPKGIGADVLKRPDQQGAVTISRIFTEDLGTAPQDGVDVALGAGGEPKRRQGSVTAEAVNPRRDVVDLHDVTGGNVIQTFLKGVLERLGQSVPALHGVKGLGQYFRAISERAGADLLVHEGFHAVIELDGDHGHTGRLTRRPETTTAAPFPGRPLQALRGE
ncbi:hypothetical protein [Brevundimonas sp.]|uniref:hypothetical protein n=1 Tax=Brevundimonas sp. TaxID=1871086 RepID=UPI003F72A1FC